jgi:hypothetical protein
VIDIDDPREVSGFVDFVFVGKVEKENGIKYEAVYNRETVSGAKTTGNPYTGYDITVMENVKGDLKTNDTMLFWKSGGLSMDGKYITLQEEDFLPEAGQVYMFYANAWEDGTLRILGKGGNVQLAESRPAQQTTGQGNSALVQQAAQNERNSVAQSPLYQELVEACENEIPYQRERFTAPAALLEAPAE